MEFTRRLNIDSSSGSERCNKVKQFLNEQVINQSQAIDALVEVLERYDAGLAEPSRPVGSFLMNGCTGVGKTYLVETAAQVLLGSPKDVIKIDCGEFQHSHEISKLIGSPHGYVGFGQKAILDKERIDRIKRESPWTVGILLVDELDKAHPAVHDLLLGILDRGSITLGDATHIDMSHFLIFCTSNIGSRAMSDAMNAGMGFGTGRLEVATDEQLKQLSVNAGTKHFSPEFLNRIDHVVTFNSLRREDVTKILSADMTKLNLHLFTNVKSKCIVTLSDAAKDALIDEGFSARYGARELKRVMRKQITVPLSRALASKQIEPDSIVKVDYANGEYTFYSTHQTQEFQPISAPAFTFMPCSLPEGGADDCTKCHNCTEG